MYLKNLNLGGRFLFDYHLFVSIFSLYTDTHLKLTSVYFKHLMPQTSQTHLCFDCIKKPNISSPPLAMYNQMQIQKETKRREVQRAAQGPCSGNPKFQPHLRCCGGGAI